MKVHGFWALVFLVSNLGVAQVEKLSETGLYSDITTKEIEEKNQFFSPQYPLWTDGSKKRRWIYLPPGTQIDTDEQSSTERFPVSMDHWKFPVGTKLWKEFAFQKIGEAPGVMKRVETRLIEKVAENKWEFSTYVWNEDESEAQLAPKSGIKDHYPTGENTKHDIPSVANCLNCHSRGGDKVLGFDALQLSGDRDPSALHDEGIQSSMLSFRALVDQNLLTKVPEKFLTEEPKIHASTPEARASLGYFHNNCGSCHNPNGRASYTDLFFRHSVMVDDEASAPGFLTSVNQISEFFTIPGEDESYRIKPGSPEKSSVLYRMKASGFEQMPPLGTEVHDQKAIDLISSWISSM